MHRPLDATWGYDSVVDERLAQLYLEDKRTDEAIKFATRAIKESDPRNEESYSLLVLCGDLSVKVKNYADAAKYYSQADKVSEFVSSFQIRDVQNNCRQQWLEKALACADQSKTLGIET